MHTRTLHGPPSAELAARSGRGPGAQYRSGEDGRGQDAEGEGYGQAEQLSNDDLIRERYRGIRPAAGYPACPDHTEKQILWKLLEVEKHTGMKLTESCAMYPASPVSGLYFAHPQAKYFGVGKIDRDQVLDYQRRKQMDLQSVERWLAPNLNYE